jgi:hypothetical protein
VFYLREPQELGLKIFLATVTINDNSICSLKWGGKLFNGNTIMCANKGGTSACMVSLLTLRFLYFLLPIHHLFVEFRMTMAVRSLLTEFR